MDTSPFKVFKRWYKRAGQDSAGDWFEPNATTLSTATKSGHVSARTVLLKHFDDTRFVFFTNYNSVKGKALYENPHAALLFFWPHRGEQIRIEGFVKKVASKESDAYFNSRPFESRVGAWASAQSSTLVSRADFLKNYKNLLDHYQTHDLTRPPYWGGFELLPKHFEFFSAEQFRLHNRVSYTKKVGVWIKEILSP